MLKNIGYVLQRGVFFFVSPMISYHSFFLYLYVQCLCAQNIESVKAP